MKRTVFFLSDRTGITAETLGNALLTQFEGVEFERVSCPYTDTADKLTQVLQQIAAAARRDAGRPLVFSSLVDPALRAQAGASAGVLFDLFDTFIEPLEAELGRRSSHAIGRSHGMGVYSTYKTRIDAVNYTLTHDDGTTLRSYADADLILIGVSRSGKTPTCLYLALHYGINAANYPLTEEDLARHRLPPALVPHRAKLYGLTIDPGRLHQIRSERRPHSPYASPDQCRREVRAAEALFAEEHIAHLDTSAVSIEEIATSILQQRGLVRRI
jgi:regulator of PEP synthase PpsR (kinase-PPPase family)